MIRASHFGAGVTAVVVGYSSAVVLVMDAAKQAGATEGMVVSWLLALGLGMGVSCIVYSWWYKVPVVTAWSTPGAALLLGSAGDYTLPEVIGSFVVAGALSLIVAQSRTLTTLMNRMPRPLAAALLAGILLPICMSVFTSFVVSPELAALFMVVYVVVNRFFPRLTMVLLLVTACIVSSWVGVLTDLTLSVPHPVWVSPTFSVGATIGLALPLFIITQLTQNVPGVGVHLTHGYTPNHRAILSGLAVMQCALAPFGGFTFNLAAITAALCMGEDADTDPQQRYKAAIAAGISYLVMAALASGVVVIFLAMPPVVVHLLAGLALLNTLQHAVTGALAEPACRQPALVTLLCSASGITLAQLTAPVWGLLLGLICYAVASFRTTHTVASDQAPKVRESA